MKTVFIGSLDIRNTISVNRAQAMRDSIRKIIVQLILGEIVFPSEFSLLLVCAAVEVAFPTGAKVDVPAPEAAGQGFWTLVIYRP